MFFDLLFRRRKQHDIAETRGTLITWYCLDSLRGQGLYSIFQWNLRHRSSASGSTSTDISRVGISPGPGANIPWDPRDHWQADKSSWAW